MRLEFDLIKDIYQPRINIKVNGMDCVALLDTGAAYFVCVPDSKSKYIGDDEKLYISDEYMELYKLEKMDMDVAIGGVSGVSKNNSVVYKCNMIIGDGNVGINIQDIPVAVAAMKRSSFDFIIPYTFLEYFDFSIVGGHHNRKKLILENANTQVIYHVKHQSVIITDVYTEGGTDMSVFDEILTLDAD